MKTSPPTSAASQIPLFHRCFAARPLLPTGQTRRPVRGGKHWLQVADPKRYPTITDDLLIEMFYPTSSQKARRNLVSRARKDLDRLVKDGEARIVKGRLMPPKPRE